MRALLLSFVAFLGGDQFAAGVRAYAEGRFRDAYDALLAAEAAAGHGASAELLYDLALAALKVGEVRVAEYSAEKAAARGGPEFLAVRDFLLGNAAFARCELAESEAGLPDADPTAFTRAISSCETARDLWRLAATSRADWPEARRNVERAQRKLDELVRKRAEAEQERRRERRPEPQARPDTPANPEDPTEEVERDPVAQQGPVEPSHDLLELLLALVDRKEQEKRALRRARQRAPQLGVERDW